MLKSIRFTNFKSWTEAQLNCGRITGIFGTNSSGKTSLLQFILLLKQTKDATDRGISLDLNGDFVELGTIIEAVFKHDENKCIKYDIEFEVPAEIVLSDANQTGKSSVITRSNGIKISTEIEIRKNAPFTRSLCYHLGGMNFQLAVRTDEQSKFELIATPDPDFQSKFTFVRNPGRAWTLPGPIKSYGFPDQARTYYQNAGFLADMEKEYEAALDRIYYLGPLREFPKRDYLWARSKPTDVGQRGEKAIDAILAATESETKRNLKHKSRHLPFQQIIAYFLRQMGLIESFSVEEIAKGSNRWQAKIRTRKNGSEVLLTDVGFGVSQVLPVITLLQYVPEGSTVLLEQPEIHLHPLAQANLADVIIQAATHRKVQVILESHSEHLLLRLQRRIAEEAVSNTDVKLYFCDAPSGVSSITPLEIDIFGAILNWPKMFMGDAFGETAGAELARLKRLKAAQ